MSRQADAPCEKLLQQWQVRREVANYYLTALLRLSPDDPHASQRRQELREKIFVARLSLRHADEQLRSCYEEYGQG